MANIAKYNTRVVQKHDTKANWDKATNFVPLPGEIIIYDDLDRIKIGDGTTTVVNLPFSIPTKAEIGLGNVNNTSDADKPISSATQAALDGKAARIHDHSAENITSGTMSADRLPVATGSSAGITVVYPAEKCTTFSSDSGTVTPLAVQKGAKQFAITRPSASTNKAIVRYSNTTGDVQNSKIIIEDVTNTRDTSKKANVIAVPAEGNKKMVYGYCTDQVDGTSFVGGVFPADATEYPYNAGLAIGGTSGNLLWKGDRVATATDLAGKASTSVATTSANGLMSAADKKKLDKTAGIYIGSGDMPAGYTIQIDPSAEASVIPIANGGTGATTVEGVLANFGLSDLLSSGTQIETGTYIGTRSASNSIVFSFKPKMVLIYGLIRNYSNDQTTSYYHDIGLFFNDLNCMLCFLSNPMTSSEIDYRPNYTYSRIQLIESDWSFDETTNTLNYVGAYDYRRAFNFASSFVTFNDPYTYIAVG